MLWVAQMLLLGLTQDTPETGIVRTYGVGSYDIAASRLLS